MQNITPRLVCPQQCCGRLFPILSAPAFFASRADPNLVLGSGESGKSTIVKQMKIIHQNGFTDEECMTYRPTIYRNTLDSAQAIVLAMRKIGLDCIDPTNRVRFNSSTPNSLLGSHLRHPRSMQIVFSTTESIHHPPSSFLPR